jgi:signal transduction histidine kinase
MKTYPINTILPGKSMLSDFNLLRLNDQMLMTLTDGITIFNPHNLDGNPYPPDVHIEKMSYSNPSSRSDSITSHFIYGLKQTELPWNQNRISFSYIALHYTNPAQNKYACKLDGYDKHWIQAGTQRSVTYTNLSPGTYIFHVKASNSDGVWNNKGDSVTIIIDAPWWQRWWAWALYILLFAAAVYSYITYRSRQLRRENQLLEEKIGLRTHQLSEANKELSQQQQEITTQRDQLAETVTDLKATQTQLIQSEKMASLGELTAGIAHEIQNPLNFVNNFSEVNTELIEEMQQEIDKGRFDEVKEIAIDIKENQQKINHHGKRADAIVKGMLQHSRAGSDTKEFTDINKLADEYLRLAYHGLRAKDKSFNAELVTNFTSLPLVNIVPQEIGRVLVNLFTNAFYATQEKRKLARPGYNPTIEVSTSVKSDFVEIIVKDNGTGIPEHIKEKIMQPFFTTKPTGEGTGLGLSLSYDIVVKGHGGSIKIDSKEGEGSEFIILLPVI